MTKTLYADGVRCAVYEAAPGADPDAPAWDPASWLSYVYFHSDFDYYSLIGMGTTTINHASVAGVAGDQEDPPDIVFGTPSNVTVSVRGQVVETSHLIANHSLGYVPKFFLTYNGMMIPHGTPIQRQDASRLRFVSAYATTSIIGLKELAYSTDSNLDAVSIAYGYMIFRDPSTGLSGDQLLLEPGNVWFGKGKFRSSENHLRITSTGDSPYAVAMGPTAGYGNGGIRVATPDGTLIDVGPFSGSFTAPSTINVGV